MHRQYLMTNMDRKKVKTDLRELNELVHEWNPLGIPDLPKDEYSCCTPLIYQQLLVGVSVDDLTEYLNRRLEDHFGAKVTETGQARNREYAGKFLEWWKSKSGTNR